MCAYAEIDAERRDAVAAVAGRNWQGLSWWMMGNPPTTTDLCAHYHVRSFCWGLLRVSRIVPLSPVEPNRSANCVERDYLLYPEEIGQILGGN